jgi:polysaccharide export outer membrane protein
MRIVFKTASVIMLLLLLLLVPATGRAEEYVIGDGDLLKITVYDNPDLTTEARVGGDGKITFPLIGDVDVRGLTVIEAQKKIALLLGDGFIKNPQVSVFVSEYKSKKVTALGEFTKPGLIELHGNATLMEVISNAGGLTLNAGETLVIKRQILKPGSDRKEDVSITVDLDKLLTQGDVSANVTVLDGDSIYVPLASFVYVTGEVKTPGAYKITKGLTVLRAITLAGGFTQKAWKGRTTVIRKTDKGEKTIDVKMEELVMPDDVIMVPQSFF